MQEESDPGYQTAPGSYLYRILHSFSECDREGIRREYSLGASVSARMDSSSLMVTGDATMQRQDFGERYPSDGKLAPPPDCSRHPIGDDVFERQ